jgi:hypothetical protein
VTRCSYCDRRLWPWQRRAQVLQVRVNRHARHSLYDHVLQSARLAVLTLEEWALALESAPRLGAAVDEPEGARYLILSDTLAREVASSLRQSIAGLQGLGFGYSHLELEMRLLPTYPIDDTG